MKEVKKVALAYSGGLDTSIIIQWLKENYNDPEIIAVCLESGQGEETEGLEEKALKSGASKYFQVDIRKELVEDHIFPMAMAGSLYEGKYFLGTSIARPLQAKKQVEIALAEGCDALCHGCTGKGNDQVRFELTYKALAPNLTVIAPWRTWDIQSREDAIEYAKTHGIDLGGISETKIYSRDRNIWHISHEGGELEDLRNRPLEKMFVLSKSPADAPDKETEITIDFESGIPVGLNGSKMDAIALMEELNRVGGENGIGRADILENRLVGMKSHGVYETPGGTILYEALHQLKTMVLDKDSFSMLQQLAIPYAEMVYNGKYFTNLRTSLELFIRNIMRFTTGSVTLVLYKGNIIIAGKESPYSLYNEDIASFTTGENYTPLDAAGFINLYGLQLKIEADIQNDKK